MLYQPSCCCSQGLETRCCDPSHEPSQRRDVCNAIRNAPHFARRASLPRLLQSLSAPMSFGCSTRLCGPCAHACCCRNAAGDAFFVLRSSTSEYLSLCHWGNDVSQCDLVVWLSAGHDNARTPRAYICPLSITCMYRVITN